MTGSVELTWPTTAGLEALPVARLHPLVRDTSRPAPSPDLLAFTELAARPLKAAAEAVGETGAPRGPAYVVGLAAAGSRSRMASFPVARILVLGLVGFLPGRTARP